MIIISHETIRTNLFKVGLKHILKDTNYTIGTSVGLPSNIKGSYNMYGTSRNDICITHKQFYNLQRLSAAIVHTCDNASQDYPDSTFLNAGVMELKQNDHALDQAAKEMIKTAGDILI